MIKTFLKLTIHLKCLKDPELDISIKYLKPFCIRELILFALLCDWNVGKQFIEVFSHQRKKNIYQIVPRTIDGYNWADSI